MTARRQLMGMAAIVLLLSGAWAQRQHDPLNDAEIDELRDAAQMPEARIQLFVKFSRARLARVEQGFSDVKASDRAQQTHDRLQAFLDVYDELNDNIDTFVGRKADLRKPLKQVIEADTEFQAKLRAIQNSGTVSKKESSQYEFLLNNAIETVDTGVQDHRQLLTDQEDAFRHKKK
jgi:hypothetical protein